jgi:hypothetical protein
VLSSDSEDEDDDLLDTPQHRNREQNLFAQYAAGSRYAKEVKALFTEDIEAENDDEKEKE